MRRSLIIALGAALIVGACAYLNREPLILSYLALQTPKTTTQERAALLEPFLRFYPPADREPPYPAVLQFHGCGGPKPPFQEQWAKVANEAGYMAVVVDSYAPRGISRERALKTVCMGKELIGQERAGDVLAALDIARGRPDIDADRIVLAGWSHGAWSVMDFVALATAGKSPAGLSGAGRQSPAIAGAILVYPHCGIGAWSKVSGWKSTYPTLALLAGKDSVVDPKACPPILARLAAQDPRVWFHIYPDADHAFDDPYLPEGWTHLYNRADHADAARRYQDFLGGLASAARQSHTPPR